MDKVKIGVVGVGGMGQQHITNIKEVEEAELVAVADVNFKLLEKVSKEYNVPGFTDYRELIKSGLAEAVLIATPHYYHPEIGIAAMEAGLHCLCEKPIAVSVDEADRFVKVACETKKVFAVMYQYRTFPWVRLAREIVQSGKLGEIRRTCMIEPNYRTQFYYNTATWRATWRGEGGGVLINQAPHGIDLFLLLGGMPTRVFARTRTRLHKIEVEDEVDALLEYPSGAWGYYYTTTNEVPTGIFMEISGDRGKLLYEDGSLKFYSFKNSIADFTFSSNEMWAKPEVVEEKLEPPQCRVGHKEIIRNFCCAILYGEELLAPGEEGARSVEFINALILSGKKRKWVNFPINREEYRELLENLKKTSCVKIE